ncbi:MAG: ferritin [bacterium]
MLISEKINAAINEQIGREFGASLQYVAIAGYFDAENLPQLASYFHKQADEEREHALKFVRFIADTGGRVAVPAVSAAKSQFSSAEEAVKLSLEWEEKVTQQIYDLVNLAAKEGNWITHHFLQWYVDEQLEEVSSMDLLLDTVRRAKDQLLFVEDYLARAGHPEEK